MIGSTAALESMMNRMKCKGPSALKAWITGLTCLVSMFLTSRLSAQGVLTWHNDAARTGQNLTETLLSPSNVNSASFGLKFKLPVDGKVDAQPLYVPSLTISAVPHNVLYVATENDTVYAFDADRAGSPLWSKSVLLSGETASDNRGCDNVSPTIGILATPAIDLSSGPHGTIYVAAISKDSSGNYHQRLHALDLITGTEQTGWPITVQATYPGNSPNSAGGVLTFDPKQYSERAALLISNGVVYTTWASLCDSDPDNGWIIGYNESTQAQVVLNLTPNGSNPQRGAIWMAGGPAADARGNLYLLTANGTFDTTLNVKGFPNEGDYGNGLLNLSTTGGLTVSDYFTMDNTVSESANHADLGSGGAMLLPTLNDAMGNPRELAVGAGKDGLAYVVDRNNMGKFNVNSSAVYQEFRLGNPVYSSPAWFNNTLYYGAVGSPISAYTFSGGSFNTSSPLSSSHSFGVNCANTGATPSISANGSANGIVWASDTPCDNNQNHQAAVLYAFDAGTLTELYDSKQNTSENFGTGITFATPTVANGKVYVGTNTDVAVFGLLNCTYDSNQTVTSSTTFMISVTTGAGCSWSVINNSDFITITGDASVVGSGTASFELAPYGGASRSGTVVVAGQRYTITQIGSDSSVPTPSNRTPANKSVLSGIAGTPSTVLVTPSSGSGASQTFALKYSDTAGASSLQQVWVYFNATLANPARNACLLYYSALTNQISLLGDNGTTWQAATLGSATTLQNSQCTVNAATSTVSSSGNTLTWNAAMTFKPAYAGVKNTYLMAVDVSGTSSAWQQSGSWTVSGTTGTPAVVSVTPSSGSGASHTFALQYSDTSGAASLQQVWVYFNSTLANPASNACLLYYSAASNQINLLGDNGTAWQAATLGSATTLQNSQCSINAATATVASSGNALTWNVPMTFKPAYAGAKNTYLRAIDISGTSSGWQQLGSWTVASAAGTPAVVSVTPSSGSGASQTFALQYSDTAGAGSLQQVWVYFNSTLANPASNACLLYYSAVTNQINLLGDNGTAWQAVTLGSAATLQNSQCSINAATSTVASSGNSLTWNAAMTFKPAYAGAKNTYLMALDGSGTTSGWQQLGSWTAGSTTTSTPAAVSVTPGSGSGASQTFAVKYSDTTGAASLQQVWVYFNATLANPASNACLLYYSAVTNQMNLLGDNGITWQAATLGSTATLQNSQCSVNVAAATVVPSGNTLTWNVPMTFKAAYAGGKNTYLMAVDKSGTSSGWQPLGAWTVPAATQPEQPPTAPSNLTAIEASGAQIDLSWTASTSNVGLANYIVQRCQGASCTNFAEIATPAGTTYNDTGLLGNTSYHYQVQAIDTAGNTSPFSNIASATTASATTGYVLPLKASSNNRYLVDQNGTPFLIMGDSPQALVGNLGPTDMASYMADRQRLGFNALWVNLLCASYTFCNANGTTFDGVAPFTSGSSPSDYALSTPNSAYFTLVDNMLNLAAAHNLVIFLDPIETGGWLVTLENNGTTNAFNYGVYFGTRYKNFPNIDWLHGNDFQSLGTSSDNNLVKQVMAGIASVDSNHLQTIELNYQSSYSNQDTALASLLNVDSAYTYFETYDIVLQSYNSSPTIPTYLVESNYEYENTRPAHSPANTGAYVLREQAYWTMLSGGVGQIYGNHYTTIICFRLAILPGRPRRLGNSVHQQALRHLRLVGTSPGPDASGCHRWLRNL